MRTDRPTRCPRSLALVLALLACPVLAPLPAAAQASGLHAGTLEVPVNKSQVVSADRPIAKAMIGSAEIADILPVTDRSVYVLGKKMGTTSLTLYDAAGRVISIMDVAVGPDVESLGDQLRQLLPDEKIDARISNESVLLTGMVSSAGAADRAAQLARAYAGDKVINLLSMGSSQQVMLEVRFAEVQRNVGKDLGVQAGFRNRSGRFSGVTGAGASMEPRGSTVTTTVPLPGGGTSTVTTTDNTGQLLLSPITGAFGILRKSFSLGGLDVSATINALEERGLAKTLAQPTLIALSGEKASFLAGGEFPVPVAQQGGGTQNGNQAITVQFKPFGVGLAFTPTVLGDKTISMIVEPEVSAIDASASLQVGNIVVPGLRVRRASTTLELRDGESFAIAGLLQRDFETTVSQVPILGSLPIIGALFRSSSFKKGETELLIVVTPHLVAPIAPGQVRLPTDRVSDPGEFSTLMLGQPYAPVPVAPAAGQSTTVPAQGGQGAASIAPAKQGDGYAY